MHYRATLPSPTEENAYVSVRRAREVTAEDIHVVFQPIVDLGAGWTVAYEALTRCKWPGFESPIRLFDWAQNENCIGQLGRVVRDVAFGRCDDAPLFVNIHPRELNEGWLVRPDDPMFFHDHPVYLEITESAAFDYFDLCLNVLREVASRGGVYLVVDDLGAGYSNLKRVLDLEPKIVKLDIALVRGIEKNPRQRTLVRQVVALCHELGADVVAEGIETLEELKAVCDTGAQYGQGYLFARPGYPIPRAAWPLPRTDVRRGSLAGEPNSLARSRL